MQQYATQMDAAKRGIITPQMQTVAEKEGVSAEVIRQRVAEGTVAIPANIIVEPGMTSMTSMSCFRI